MRYLYSFYHLTRGARQRSHRRRGDDLQGADCSTRSSAARGGPCWWRTILIGLHSSLTELHAVQLWPNVADASRIPHGTKLQTKEELQVMNARRREEEEDGRKQSIKQSSKRRKETEICCKTLSAELLPLRRCFCCCCALAKKRELYRGDGSGVATRNDERRRKKGSERSCRRSMKRNAYTDVKETRTNERTNECGRRPRRRRREHFGWVFR